MTPLRSAACLVIAISVLAVTSGCASKRPRSFRSGPVDVDGATAPRADSSPEAGDGGAVVDSRLARVRGVVYAPGNAPSLVPTRHEIPIFDALVEVRATRPDPIPAGVYCEPCQMTSGTATASDHEGRFDIDGVLPGTYWLVVQKGQFRRETQVTLEAGKTFEAPIEATTLPSRHDPENGLFIPRIAVATGSYDHLEDVLGKMGIGSLSSSGELTSGDDQIDFYSNDGRDYAGMRGTLSELVSDLDELLRYHVIFIPCAGAGNTFALRDPIVLRNLREYVSRGGKLYVTDWSGEWHDNVFPAQITLQGSTTDTPAEAYDAASMTWNPNLFGDADGSPYDSYDAEAVDEDLHRWLSTQYGPDAEYFEDTAFNPDQMTVVGNWNVIERVDTVEVGVGPEGLPALDEPHVFVIGSDDESSVKKPLTVTYEPTGCGRVLFSTYHTTDDAHPGLVPQERILLYLIMEIGVCKEGPILF